MADGLAAKTGERLLRVSGEQQDNMGDAECAGDAPQAVHEMLLDQVSRYGQRAARRFPPGRAQIPARMGNGDA